MKNFSLLKAIFLICIFSQSLVGSLMAEVKFQETILTTNKKGLSDPYFQITTSRIEEISEDELKLLAGDFAEDNSKNKVDTKQSIIPNIPPKPPESKGGVPDNGGGSVSTPNPTPTPAPSGFFDGVIMIVDKLIAIGQKIIPTIEKGKAVVSNNPMASISVLPRLDTKDPVVHDMGGWTIPYSKHYKISFLNGFNSEVVSFVYSITYQYNGQHGGKGKYLTGVRASARNINIAWGFDLDASSQLLQISNIGTEDVIAGATIEMSYTVKNWTRTVTTNESFFVAGDGRLFKLD